MVRLMRSSSHTHRLAKSLRRTMSPPETLLWERLRRVRRQGLAFRRQRAIGPYVADFCSAARLVVEVDGAAHTEDRQVEHDRRRDAHMQSLGYRPVRVPAGEIMLDADETAQRLIEAALAEIARRRRSSDAALRPLHHPAAAGGSPPPRGG